ncbi:MAG TPA: hypothetical protein VK348_08775, partial [Planctomycetota bacterium]|nr:hypothetical protein [Planctomycetota bacterium]
IADLMPDRTHASVSPARPLLQGALAALALAAVLVAMAVLPEGTAAFVFGGVALAIAAAGLGSVLQARIANATTVQDQKLAAASIQIALGATFVAKLLAIGLGTGALWLAGVKFEALAAFALAFAAASLVVQVCTAHCMARALAQRAQQVNSNQVASKLPPGMSPPDRAPKPPS